MDFENKDNLETQISHWRSFLLRHHPTNSPDVEKLESHLRENIVTLQNAGLDDNEAFLIALKRMGNFDDRLGKFAQEHWHRLLKQLVQTPDTENNSGRSLRIEMLVVIGLALSAALAIKLPELFGLELLGAGAEFYIRNLALFVLPLLASYFAWKRDSIDACIRWLVPSFAIAAVFANIYPFRPFASTEILTALHLPVVLWLAVGFAYVGGQWRSTSRRMDFVRFSGELFIYYVLIALGGVVLTTATLLMFSVIGLDLEWIATSWLLPCGAVGAVIIGSWLVEVKQKVVENMAPVLTQLFTPLFAIVLLAFLVTMIWTGKGIDAERDVLIGFDLLLILILGLLVYNVSARGVEAQPNGFDALQLVLVLSALVVDVLLLIAIAGRIFEHGVSANKVSALAENLILLVNLIWSAWLYFRFLIRRGSFRALERWQTNYLPVYGVWALVVVVAFPPGFDFI